MRVSTKHTVDIAAWITLGTLLLYLAGWFYAQHWFGHFYLGLIHLDLPTEYHLMYGFWVLRDYLWGFVAVFVFAGLVVWGYRLPAVRSRWRMWAGRLRLGSPTASLRWGSLPLLATIFLSIHALGERSADHDFARHRDKGFDRYPWTRVWLAPYARIDPVLTNLAEDLAGGRYRLLLQSETSLFLIKPETRPKDKGNIPADQRQDNQAGIPTVQIPLRQVKAIRRIPINPGRE